MSAGMLAETSFVHANNVYHFVPKTVLEMHMMDGMKREEKAKGVRKVVQGGPSLKRWAVRHPFPFHI